MEKEDNGIKMLLKETDTLMDVKTKVTTRIASLAMQDPRKTHKYHFKFTT